MKKIKVVAAVILQDNKVFAVQRSYGEFQDGWEFPGGKIEEGETPQAALLREMEEELDIEIDIDRLFDTVEFDYPNFHLSMECYISRLKSGNLKLKEHKAAKWLSAESIKSVEWLPADLKIIEKLQDFLLEKNDSD